MRAREEILKKIEELNKAIEDRVLMDGEAFMQSDEASTREAYTAATGPLKAQLRVLHWVVGDPWDCDDGHAVLEAVAARERHPRRPKET